MGIKTVEQLYLQNGSHSNQQPEYNKSVGYSVINECNKTNSKILMVTIGASVVKQLQWQDGDHASVSIGEEEATGKKFLTFRRARVDEMKRCPKIQFRPEKGKSVRVRVPGQKFINTKPRVFGPDEYRMIEGCILAIDLPETN